MANKQWRTVNPGGSKRIIVTKELPGQRWLDILTNADCKVEICTSEDILSTEEISAAIGDTCDGAIGQLTETWGYELYAALKDAGTCVYSNYAVGYNNIDLEAATRYGIPVGNTPGVLTEATAEMCVALAFAAARRVGEAERFIRANRFNGWLPTLFIGELFHGGTVGVVGAGRIGGAFAKMMAACCRMNVLYHDVNANRELENYIDKYSVFLISQGENAITCRRCDTLEELLEKSNLVSLNTVLDDSTHHLINAERLALMKQNAVLINASRGPVIDEQALVFHCQKNPKFRAGLDVFEHEPQMQPSLKNLDNVIIVPHIASATAFTRESMAILAASNVAGILQGYPAWMGDDVATFLSETPPKAAPSIVNATGLNYPCIRET
jgi:hydroxypyruvate reductase 1